MARRKKKKTVSLTTLIVAVAVIAGAIGTQVHHDSSSSDSNTRATQQTSTHATSSTSAQSTTDLANLTYAGKQIVTVNNNQPTFTNDTLSIAHGSWQTFSNLDSLNRVGAANAMLGKDLMPTAKRDPLYINPTGWHNKKVNSDGESVWLYNRSHLIGYQLTGQNNNIKNLMTGTASLNSPSMENYESEIAKYIKTTNHHVRYQVEPIFRGTELLARGVHMQAQSIEDKQIAFNIYIFNVEDGVTLNYSDGTSTQ